MSLAYFHVATPISDISFFYIHTIHVLYAFGSHTYIYAEESRSRPTEGRVLYIYSTYRVYLDHVSRSTKVYYKVLNLRKSVGTNIVHVYTEVTYA